MSVSSAIDHLAQQAVAIEAYIAEEAATKPISVRLPESLVMLLDNIARELHITRSEVIQTILFNGAEEAAHVLSEYFASEADRSAYCKSLRGPLVWGASSTEGGDN